MPTLSVLRREFNDLKTLNSNILQKLGLTSGSVLMRLDHKPSINKLTLQQMAEEREKLKA